MTSPATMRLMGLLVIMGMVAGCGDAESPADSKQDLADARAAVIEEAKRLGEFCGTWRMSRGSMGSRQAADAGLTPEEAAFEGSWYYDSCPGSPRLIVSFRGTFEYLASSDAARPMTSGSWRVEEGVLILSHSARPSIWSIGMPLETRHTSLWVSGIERFIESE